MRTSGILGGWRRAGWFAAVAFFVAIFFLFFNWRHSRLLDRPYRIGFQSDPPYQIARPDGSVDGLAISVVSEAAHRHRTRLHWIPCPEGPDVALRSRKVDLWPLLSDRPERRRYSHISVPWYTTGHCLLSLGELPRDLTGYRISCGNTPVDASRCRESGMDDYLAKPFRAAALAAKLDRWLAPESSAPAPQPQA